MRITALDTFPTRTDVPPYSWRDGLPGSPGRWESTWLRITTDDEVEGWALFDRGPIAEDLVARCLRPLFLGADPLQKELAWHRVLELDRVEELPIYALGVVDVALWDITGRVAGLPLAQLLGGARERVPAYASTSTFPTAEEFLEVADQCLEHGFKAIKLHAWGDARRDAALCQRLRAHVGAEIDLMYDGSAGFGPADALYVGRALEEAGYRWYEEPMREFGTAHYVRLCDALDIPVLAPETTDGIHYTAAEWLRLGAADLVRTGVDYRGVTGALRVAHVADAFHTNAEVHGGGLANLHLAAAVRNNAYYESMVLTNPIQVEPAVTADGDLVVPRTPGIGYDEDELRDVVEQAAR